MKPNYESTSSLLKKELEQIETKMLELLDISTIKERRDDPYSGVVIVAPSHYWSGSDEKQMALQNGLNGIYRPWYNRFLLLIKNSIKSELSEVDSANKFVLNWIERNGLEWGLPATIKEAKELFSKEIRIFYDILNALDRKDEEDYILIPDTNSLIKCPEFSQYSKVLDSEIFTIVILPTVLKELDKLKIHHRDENFRKRVESIISRIKGLRNQGRLLDGVTINKTITVKMEAKEPDFKQVISWLDPDNNDDRIIASVMELQVAKPSSMLILVTSDINLQNKAELAHLPFVEPPLI